MSILNKIKQYLFNPSIKSVKQEVKTKKESLIFNEDHYIENSKYKSVLVLTDFYGDILESNVFNDCLKANLNVQIKVKYNLLTKRKAKFIIHNTERKINNASSSINNNSIFNDLSSNNLEQYQEDVEQLKDMIGTNKLIEFIYLVVIESDNLDNLRMASKELVNIGEDNGLILSPLLYNQIGGYKELNTNLIKLISYKKRLIDKDFIKLIPIKEQKQKLTPKNLWIGKTQESNQIITVSYLNSSNENNHALLLGTTRFGKSTLLKLKIIQARILGYNIVLIDPQGEYKKLAKLLYGDVKKCGYNHSFKLLNGGLNDEDKETYIGLLSDYLVSLNKEEGLRSKLNTCLYDLLNLPSPTMEAFFKIVTDKDKQDNLNNRLVDSIAPLFKGKLGSMLTGNQALTINNKLTVFDFSELQSEDINDKFKGMYLSLFSFVISKSLHNRGNKTLFIIDEAYQLLDNPTSQAFLLSTIKKIGKFNTSVILSLQDLNNSPEFGATLYNLCNYKYIFRQEDTSYLLPYLDRQELDKIKQFDKGQFLFVNQNKKTFAQTCNPELMPNLKQYITF